ncbi:MAG TPA: hypothetical protein PJ991_00185 [Kiritimatiellia bacterium]|nr:hypothetical protein [Kiritimatiellia bacterium]
MYPISVINPLDRAWDGMVKRLFKPFLAKKWFALGFSAWLATLLSGIGFPTFNFFDTKSLGLNELPLLEFWRMHSEIIITVVGITIILGTLLGILFMWISSRGAFMFLKNVVNDTTEVSKPWHDYRDAGNSLFLWQLGFSILCMLVTAVLVAGMILALWPMFSHDGAAHATRGAISVGSMIGIAFVMFFAGLLMTAIYLFLIEFVVPLMMKHGMRTNEAWMLLLPVIKHHPGTFILYLLFRFVLNIGVGFVMVIAGLLTCCCLFFLLVIPYINAVVVLPVTVFLRLYSIEFLRAFGPDFDVFSPGSLSEELPQDPATPDIPSPS